jgi:ribosomal protein L40E
VETVEKDMVDHYDEVVECVNCGEMIPANAPVCHTCNAINENMVEEPEVAEQEEPAVSSDDEIYISPGDEASLSHVLERLKALKSEITTEYKTPPSEKKKKKDFSKVAKCGYCGELIPPDAQSCPRCEATDNKIYQEIEVEEPETPEPATSEDKTSKTNIEVSLNNLLERLQTIKNKTPIEETIAAAEKKLQEIEEDEEDVELVVCGSCGELNPSDASSCSRCGVNFTGVFKCPECQALITSDSTCCESCGTKFEPEEEDEDDKENEIENNKENDD